ncbi:MAG: ribonuclease P protein component [Candidatus Colwellbacteria bacterium]
MLAKKLKLPIKEFPKRGASTSRGKLLAIKRIPNGLDYSRVGILVSKKINPKASARNSIKRIVYSAFGERLLALPTGMDLLVVIEAPIMVISVDTKKELLEDLDNSLGALTTK